MIELICLHPALDFQPLVLSCMYTVNTVHTAQLSPLPAPRTDNIGNEWFYSACTFSVFLTMFMVSESLTELKGSCSPSGSSHHVLLFEPILALFVQASVVDLVIISFSQKFDVSVVSGKRNNVFSKTVFGTASLENNLFTRHFTVRGGRRDKHSART